MQAAYPKLNAGRCLQTFILKIGFSHWGDGNP